MPAVKGRASSAPHRYRPAAEYDDATLAQKREYWRNKKREQRARLSEHRGRPERDYGGATLPLLHVPVQTVGSGPGPQIGLSAGDRREEEERLQTELSEEPTSNGTQMDTSSSEPPAIRTSSSSSAPVSQSAAPVQPKLVATALASQCGHVSVKTEATTPDAAPFGGTASDATASSAGFGAPPVLLESEEERAAKRREHWRIKKREQRAKLAAQVARERTQGGAALGPGLLPAALVRGAARKPGPIRVSLPFPARGGAADLPQHRLTQTSAMLDASVQKAAANQRRALGYPHHWNATRGIARCRTPRQRLIDTPRSFRCKTPSMASLFAPRALPRILPSDSPEQIIAKRREYWRVKKREQRAKLSMETKAWLKEKDSLMRRVKRYQQILEEMRRARALTQSAGSGLPLAADAIGGFIKEDGTLTVNVLHGPKQETAAGVEELLPKNSLPSLQHRTLPRRSGVPLVRINLLPPLVRKAPKLLTIRPHPHPASSGLAAASSGVKKMAISPLMALTLNPELTEEEKMAKKREYWRVKKREQRAARAGPALQRRKPHKQAVAMETDCAGSTQALPSNGVAVPPHGDRIKQEFEPEANLNPPAEPGICPDVKPPSSPPPPLEPDGALSGDSQATTLLAVASMKKLLEESLSTVTESRSQQTVVKTEAAEDDPEPDVKPGLPPVFFQDDVSPLAADLTLQIKSWHPDTQVTSDLHLKAPSKPVPAPSEVLHPSPTPPAFRGNVSMETPDGTTSPRRTQRLCSRKAGQPDCCSPAPPRLHPNPPFPPHHQERQQDGERSCKPGPEQGGLSSLQRKREYWKMMKRQQRARLKARHRDRPGDGGGNIQTAGRPAGPTQPSVSSLPGLVGPAGSEQAADPVQIQLPPTGGEEVHQLQNMSESPRCSLEWAHQSLDLDPAPSLTTLKPPENPLSSINLQPMESPGHSPTSSPIKIPHVQLPSLPSMVPFCTKPAPVSSLVPPKPVPGESEEDFLRRKREYWRIKKKEQRARKAVQDKGGDPRRSSSSSWTPILPVQEPASQTPVQDSRGWTGSSEPPEHLMSPPADSGPGPCPYPDYSAPAEGESELLFAEDGDGAVSDAVWRKRYLMDHDPLNQLLVCMVCGELQYSHSLEGVAAHIEDAHPHTLSLEPAEKQRILEAWDEQVSRRERFFTSQLQQHGGTLTETNMD